MLTIFDLHIANLEAIKRALDKKSSPADSISMFVECQNQDNKIREAKNLIDLVIIKLGEIE